MTPLSIDDVLGRDRYGAQREDTRRRLIEHKRSRRVAVGDRLVFVFEDRATVWYQTQEMLWVEHVTDLDAIRNEIAVYNELLPGDAELSATLLIAVGDQSRMAEELHRLIGIDEHVTLVIGDDLRVPARFEPDRQTAEKLSAVQYVRFTLPAVAVARVREGAPLALAVDHPAYRVRTELPEAVRASVAADLCDPSFADAALERVRHGR